MTHNRHFLVCVALFGAALACSPYTSTLSGESPSEEARIAAQGNATATADMVRQLTEVAASGEQLTQAAANQPPTQPPAPGARSGVITFDQQQATFDGEAVGLGAGCRPPNPGGSLTLAPDGKVTGSCGGTIDAFATTEGALSGRYDAQSGNI